MRLSYVSAPLEHLLLESFLASVMPAIEEIGEEKWDALSAGIGWWFIPSEYYEVSLPRLRTAL